MESDTRDTYWLYEYEVSVEDALNFYFYRESDKKGDGSRELGAKVHVVLALGEMYEKGIGMNIDIWWKIYSFFKITLYQKITRKLSEG